MKKILLILMILLVSTVFIACKSDNETLKGSPPNNSTNILGEWQIVSGDLTIYEDAYSSNSFHYGASVEIFENKKMIITILQSSGKTFTIGGNYSIYDDSTIEINFGSPHIYDYEFTDNKIKIVNTDENEECILGIIGKENEDSVNNTTESSVALSSITYPLGENSTFFKNGLVPVNFNEKWGYVNDFGELIIEAKFEMAWDFSPNGLALVKVDGKYGFINNRGEFEIEPNYLDAWSFDVLGYASVSEVSWNGPHGVIKSDGKYLFDDKFSIIREYSKNGLAAASPLESNDRIFGYINTKGEWVIQSKYNMANPFNEFGIATVSTIEDYTMIWALIDEKGNELTGFDFTYISEFDTFGNAVAIYNPYNSLPESISYVINTKGEILLEVPGVTLELSNYENKFLITTVDSKTGVIDIKGTTLIEPIFDDITTFYDDRAAAILSDKLVLIDSDGIIIKELLVLTNNNPRLYHAIKNNVFLYYDNNIMSYYTTNGEKLGEFDSIYHLISSYERPQHVATYNHSEYFMYKDGYALFYSDKKYGIIDENGKVIAGSEYMQIRNCDFLSDLYE